MPVRIVLAIEARDFAFSPGSLTAPTDAAIQIAFANADAAIPHNVTVTTDAGVALYSGKIVTGVSAITYAVPALSAGRYRIGCIVHPAMTGTLTVR